MRLGPAVVLAAIAASAVPALAQAQTIADPALSLLQAAYAGPADLGRTNGLSYVPGQGLVSWRTDLAGSFGPVDGRHVDTLRISTATIEQTPALALTRPAAITGEEPSAFAFTYVRNWPAALSVQAGRLNLDLTPHAGLGLSSSGSQVAEAGALLRLGALLQNRMLDAADGALDGSRLFLFAGATKRAIGLNLLGKQALSGRANPRGDGSVREAQAGVGLKKGVVSASFGYTYERTRMKTFGGDARKDNRVGLTLAIRP